jgi:hypothetical protein
VGGLTRLAHTTLLDVYTVVSLLAQHQSNPSPGHLDAALYVVRYLSTTKTMWIYFTSTRKSVSDSFLCFPLPHSLLSMSDANCGPQDATQAKYNFATSSMSAFYIDLFVPLHWISK